MTHHARIDPRLYEYATDRQAEVLKAWDEHGSLDKAAEALSLHRSSFGKTLEAVKARAAKQGYSPEHDYTRSVPDGYRVKGVSTYYDKDGKPRGQWVKSQIDHERQAAMIEAMIAGMNDQITRVPLVSRDTNIARLGEESLMTAYPVGDHHIGMLAWDKETGDDWDMKIAESVLGDAVDHLVRTAPHSETALVAFLGDFMHYDSFVPETPRSRNQLDADSRFPKMARVALRCMRYMITAALTKHQQVHVIVEIGNHDPASSIWLMEAMNMLYENEPRVTVDTSPMQFHYFRFGKVLIGTAHGHDVKMQALPLIMAHDRKEDWGQTEYRHWWTGHIHHSKTQAATSARDYTGCTVESFRILAASDAWAHQKGYRAARDMKSITFHKEYGEVSRNTVNPEMFK